MAVPVEQTPTRNPIVNLRWQALQAAGVDRLALELVTQTFAEQNDVWSVLRTTYHPSVMYRVRLIVVRDEKPADVAQVTQPIVVTVRRRAS